MLATGMLRAAHGLELAPPANESSRVDLRAYEQILRLLRELEAGAIWRAPLCREEVLAALERMPVRLAGAAEPGQVAIIDLLRARTRRFEAVFVSRPRGGQPSPAGDGLAVPRRTMHVTRDPTSGRAPRRVGRTPVARERSFSMRRARGRPVA